MLQERVCFPPHPKTLTMAGDYEYFAAQGHHPFAFALAELIDNALRATKRNVDRPREIKISFVVGDGSRERGGGGDTVGGLVCVQDSGGGMSKRELNDWAVMNLSMEDRGLLDVEALAAAEPGTCRVVFGGGGACGQDRERDVWRGRLFCSDGR